MKIVYEHLLRFLPTKPSIDDISEKLFQLGHEHEVDGSIFDMEFTPNRGDCLSLLGLARDLNIFYETNLELPIFNEELSNLDINFVNNAHEKCPEISFLKIEVNDQITEYKDYLNSYFKDLNLNKNNFFTDVSNYIAYEMGQPTHAYNFSSIDNDIILQDNTNECEFKTLLGKSIKLDSSDLVFVNKDHVINLAGIVGGMNSACSNDTKSVLVECAYFRPESIINKAIKYDLHSDASHKFERGVDRKCQEKVLRRFIQIVSDHTEIDSLSFYKYTNNQFDEIELDIDINKINNILGMQIDQDDYLYSLSKLGFQINDKIKVPSFRNDISHQNDLAEELARVIGYDNIPQKPIQLPSTQIINKPLNVEKIKNFLIDQGFSEVINPPFTEFNEESSIRVDNPLDRNRQYLRTNLTESLINNLNYNEKRQKDSIRLFEISDVYSFNKEIIKEERLAVIVSGRRGENYIDFSKLLNEKYLVNLFNQIDLDFQKEIISINRNRLNSKVKTPIFSLEIPLNKINKSINYKASDRLLNNFVQYQPISEFPSSYRDFSFSIDNSLKINEVNEKLSNSKSKYLKKSFMFDFYENKKTKQTKIGFRFIFQSNDKTLTDQEIDNDVNEILQPIISIDSVTIPGRE